MTRVVISRKGFTWEQIPTRPGIHFCRLPHGTEISVERMPRLDDPKAEKPWRVEVFGSGWHQTRYQTHYAELNDAKFAAESIAIDVLDSIAKHLGFELRAES